LCTRNLFLQDKQWTSIFILTFWKDSMTVCDTNGQNCGEVEIGCFIMTMLRPTRLSLSDSSWRRATWSFCPTHPTRPT
jgi:hypothetical protein